MLSAFSGYVEAEVEICQKKIRSRSSTILRRKKSKITVHATGETKFIEIVCMQLDRHGQLFLSFNADYGSCGNILQTLAFVIVKTKRKLLLVHARTRGLMRLHYI